MKRLALLAILAAIPAAACSGGPGDPDPPASASLSVPDEAASIIGDVTQVEGGGERRLRILVEQIPTRSAGEPIAWIDIPANARILAGGAEGTRRASAAGLVVGARVSVWFDGPVRESFPVQATAGTVLIER